MQDTNDQRAAAFVPAKKHDVLVYLGAQIVRAWLMNSAERDLSGHALTACDQRVQVPTARRARTRSGTPPWAMPLASPSSSALPEDTFSATKRSSSADRPAGRRSSNQGREILGRGLDRQGSKAQAARRT
jgi:hypothetical protein